MSLSNNTTALVALSGCAIVASAAYFLNRSDAKSRELSPSSLLQDIEEVDDELDTEMITEDDVCKIFDSLHLHMQSALAQLSQQLQQIQMSGQVIPERQLRTILKGEFERALSSQQTAIFEDHDVDEDCLEKATWEFLDDPEQYPRAKKSVERLQKLYENVSGENIVGWRPGTKPKAPTPIQELSKEKLLEALEVYFGALTKAMTDLATNIKSKGVDLSDPTVAQQLQLQFASIANDVGEAALKPIGTTPDAMQAGIQKYGNDPEVGRTIGLMQMKQQQELMAMGISM